MNYHEPVLLNESVDGLNIQPDGIYIDVTFGGGGHSREILKRLKNGKLIAFDQDKDAVGNLIDDLRFTFVPGNFAFLKNYLQYLHIEQVDGILADLGVSSHQFDEAERGFSFRFDAELDMRMNQNSSLSAKVVLNEYDEQKLSDVFFHYGEIQNARRLAKLIVLYRSNKDIASINDLTEAIKECIPQAIRNKYLAKVFQALRIEVNQEMESLKSFLLQSGEMIKKEGRLSVISYHSLEDRLVKNFIRSGNFEGKIEKDFYGNSITSFRQINNKIIIPNEEELERNPRSRSAKLRIAEKN